MLSSRVKRKFNITPLKHAEQPCADTKFEQQNIPCVYGSCTHQHVCLHETNIPQVNDSYSDSQKCPTFMKRKCSFLPTTHGQQTLSWTTSVQLTSQSNYPTIILVFAPYFHMQFPYQLFLLTSGKMICTNLFSASCITLYLSTITISIQTYRRKSISNQMFQDSNGSSRRVS
jgi:hypothetical protein